MIFDSLLQSNWIIYIHYLTGYLCIYVALSRHTCKNCVDVMALALLFLGVSKIVNDFYSADNYSSKGELFESLGLLLYLSSQATKVSLKRNLIELRHFFRTRLQPYSSIGFVNTIRKWLD